MYSEQERIMQRWPIRYAVCVHPYSRKKIKSEPFLLQSYEAIRTSTILCCNLKCGFDSHFRCVYCKISCNLTSGFGLRFFSESAMRDELQDSIMRHMPTLSISTSMCIRAKNLCDISMASAEERV